MDRKVDGGIVDDWKGLSTDRVGWRKMWTDGKMDWMMQWGRKGK
jgi:hypothetical protein